jgi:hypothetical protein
MMTLTKIEVVVIIPSFGCVSILNCAFNFQSLCQSKPKSDCSSRLSKILLPTIALPCVQSLFINLIPQFKLFLLLLFSRPRDATQGIILNIQLTHQTFVFFFKIEVPCGHCLLVQHLIFWTKKLI